MKRLTIIAALAALTGLLARRALELPCSIADMIRPAASPPITLVPQPMAAR